MSRFSSLFASMSDVQFGALMLAISAITIAAFYFGRRLILHSPVVDIDAGADTTAEPPIRRKRKHSKKAPGKKSQAKTTPEAKRPQREGKAPQGRPKPA